MCTGRVRELNKLHKLSIRWLFFPLHPDTPAEGKPLTDLSTYQGVDLKARQADMKARMDKAGLPYGERTHTYNSRLAQELGKWADTQKNGASLHYAIYEAYFVDRKNIGQKELLLDLVRDNGLSYEKAKTVLEERSFKAAVDEDWMQSHALGITGVPTFIAGKYSLVGAQEYETLVRFIEYAKTEAQKDHRK